MTRKAEREMRGDIRKEVEKWTTIKVDVKKAVEEWSGLTGRSGRDEV